MRNDAPKDLLNAAANAAKHGYAPYSGFYVGAAARTDDGSVYTGANMENASYGVTICAEVGALQAAFTAGKHKHIKELAVVGGKKDSRGDIVTPCGRCRQLISEAAELSEQPQDLKVWCANSDLSSVECFSIGELLPHAFGHRTLGT